MAASISKEAFIFLCSAAGGGVIFFIYDLFRVVRKNTGGGTLFLHIQDGVFWLIAFGVMFFIIFSVNNGGVRFYEILGAVLGAALYGSLFSALVQKGIDKILVFFAAVFKVFLKILLTPLYFAYNILYRYICLVFRPFVRYGRFVFRRLTESVKQTSKMIKKK